MKAAEVPWQPKIKEPMMMLMSQQSFENPYETFNYGKLLKKPVDDDDLSASGSSYYSTSSHLPCDLDSGSKSYLGKDDDKIQLVQSDEKGKGGNAENVER